MKTRPKPVAAEINKNHVNVRGGKGYWFRIYFIAFVLTIFSCVIATLITNLIFMVATSDGSNLSPVIGIPIGLYIGYVLVKLQHRHLMRLSQEEYEKYIQVPNCSCNSHHMNHRDSGNPKDPASASYWTFGPGMWGNDS